MRHVPFRRLITVGLLLAGAIGSAAAQTPTTERVDFTRDIRPILSNHCFQCHGPDEAAREAELRLDSRDSATHTDGPDSPAALVPRKPQQSELFARITAEDVSERMPPTEFGKPLSASQIQLIQRWIEQGAHYDQHWAFQPLDPSLPSASEQHDDAATHNAIDVFVAARLREHGLARSPEATRKTLIRRVWLDLLGLPPTAEATRAFVEDNRPGAYERMVERALASPRFGERWGRHWLDQARYADSHGYTNDNARSIWPYRDWVMDAFNRDLPFDQFTIEQLAGDMLPSPTLAQRVATGFHRNTLINSEGGTKTDQFRDEQVKDRVDTTGLVWMGLTVGCAKCHSHKFDPLTQREYYQLYAFFNSTRDANSVTPVLTVPSESQTRRLASLSEQIKRLEERLASDGDREQRQRAWEAGLPEAAKREAATAGPGFPWKVVELSGKSLQGSVLRSQQDLSLLVSGEPQPQEEFHATTRSPLAKIRSVRLEVLTDTSLPNSGPGRSADGNFTLSEFWFRTGDGRELRFSEAYAEHAEAKFDVADAVDGKKDTGWAIGKAPEGTLNRNRVAWFVLPKPLEVEQDHALTFKLQFMDKDKTRSIGRFRISISDQIWVDRPTAKRLAPLAMLPKPKRSDIQQRKLDEAFLAQDPTLGPVKQSLTEAKKSHDALRRSLPETMVLEELEKPRPAHVQTRGEFLRIAEAVEPATPRVLPPLSRSTTKQRPADRLDFARWLTDSRHPLTSRVRVNRIWMRLFGTGLVETENDFGIQSSPPTHPRLLDWLAQSLMDHQWSTKQLLRTIVCSATYRQQSSVSDEQKKKDPLNRWLGRQNRIRVEAEIVRDLALAASGQLGTTMGGPSVHPPQPSGVYAFTQRKKTWKTSEGENRYRRGMYTFFYRSAPYPMLSTFDTPKFNATCTRRSRSNTPLQSLTIANSEAMFELAGKLAQLALKHIPPSDSPSRETSRRQDKARITWMVRRCLTRDPKPAELSLLHDYVSRQRSRFDSEQDAWTAVARVLLNLDEFITRE